jgi:hypothetical protein
LRRLTIDHALFSLAFDRDVPFPSTGKKLL